MGDATLGTAVGEPLTVRYPDGGSAIGTIEEIVPDKRLVFSWGYSDPAKNLPPNTSRVAIDLAPIPSGTLITLRHSGLTREMARNHAMGWRHYLSTLANAAASVTALAGSAVDTYQAACAALGISKP